MEGETASILANFSEIVNSAATQRFWNGLRIREEKVNTQTAQIILQEKEEQNACQIRSNMLNEHIQVLERKRRNTDDYEEGLSTLPTKIRTTNSLPCDKVDFSSDSDSEIIPVSLTNIFLETAASDAPRTPLPRQAQIQFNSEDNDLHYQYENENASTEVQDLITKMENVNYRLFEYHIVNLSEKSLVDPINKVFSDDDKKRMRKFWEEMEPSAEENQNTLRRPRWENSIKPLIDKYALAVEVKPELVFDDYVDQPSTKIIFEIPFEGEFYFKKHYDMLWVQNIYQRFIFLFVSSFNMLRDANTSEIAYREAFVNPIIPKAFEDMNDKISGEIESALRKQHRNQTKGQKPRVMLGSNHDGILKIYMNASEIEIGFLEVVENAMVVDLTKYHEDLEKLFKVMQLSIFYQRQHHLRRNATEEQLDCLQSFGSRVMDYYLKLQDISWKAQKYTPSNENPLEASPAKKNNYKTNQR
ncbi:3726_t:CDS:2 [Cetraspora pellucida]|uniref:3726_t:CDS:1 n=1 Tax=Cetraspora pellucida TaxID=1433469 RepID=A0A9N9EH17_9GLOM|nr:3726_t:CDS:2 [Cetraspora pellucida]